MAMSKERPYCPVEKVLEVIGGKWKIVIIFHLRNGKKRFNELRRLMPKTTQRMLTKQLRELEEHGVIERKIYAQVPPKVEYSLSHIGKSLDSTLDILSNWGAKYIKIADRQKR